MNNVEKCIHFGWTKNNGASYGASQHYGAVGAVGAVIGYSFLNLFCVNYNTI
jgi:hypothetical protein